MSDAPAISVVMPVYNAGRYLEEAVESILAQSHRDFELLVFDDGSSDGSVDLMQKYASADKRIRFFAEQHRGYVVWLNRGLELARGEFIARMDADDVAHPNRFERQVEYLRRHPDVVVVGTQAMLIDPYGAPLLELKNPEDHDEIFRILMTGNGAALVHPSAMIRRSALERVGKYREQYQWVEDLDLYLRLADVGRLANVPEVLLRYRKHPQSVTQMRSQRQVELVRELFRERGLDDSRLVTAQPQPPQWRVRCTWAWQTLKNGHPAAARRHALAALLRRPLHVDVWRAMYCAIRGH